MTSEVFHDLTIAFYGGVFALGFYEISGIIWERILSKFIKKHDDSQNEKESDNRK